MALYITIFFGIPLLVIAAIITGQLFDLPNISTQGYLLLAAAGLTHFLVGRYSNYRCISAIGANRAAPLRSISVPFTLVMAVLVLGERVSVVNGIGIVIVMLAPMIMLQRGNKSQVSHSTEISDSNPSDGSAATVDSTAPVAANNAHVKAPRLAEGYFFGLITALVFGSSPLLIRGAIGDTGMGVAGALIAYSAAAVPLLLGLTWPGRLATLRGMNTTALRWFLLATITIFFAQMFRFVALDLAQVTVVTPLMRTGVIWTVIFAFLINRQTEDFGPRVLAAIAMSLIGGGFVVL